MTYCDCYFTTRTIKKQSDKRTIQVEAKGQTDIVEITDKVQKVVDEQKLIKGSVHLFVIGSTASITTIEDDPNLYQDFKEALEKIIPYQKNWKHHQTWGDDNGAAHIRASLMGPSLLVPVINGKLFLGT